MTVCRGTCNGAEREVPGATCNEGGALPFPAQLATRAEPEVPRANGRVAAGSAADFHGNGYFWGIDSRA